MVLLYFIIGCFLALFLSREKQNIIKKGDKKGLLYFFCSNSLDFLVPFIIVSFLYLLLYGIILVFFAPNTATIASLVEVEEYLEKIKSYFSFFKLNAFESLIIFLPIYFLGFFRFPPAKSKKLFAFFDKYNVFMKRSYMFIVLLCSFTFFGTQLGKPSETINLRIKTIRDGYAELENNIQDVLSQEVASQLYSKVLNSLPEYYTDSLDLPVKIEVETNSLSNFYSSVKENLSEDFSDVENFLKVASAKSSSATDIKVDFKDSEILERNYSNTSRIENISYKQFKSAKNLINKYKNNLKRKSIHLLNVEGGKKITCQIPKAFTGMVKKSAFEQVFKNHPVLEPFVDIFFNTLDEKIEQEVSQSVDNIIDEGIIDNNRFNKLISDKAVSIASEKEIKITNADINKMKAQSELLNNELSKVKTYYLKVFSSNFPKNVSVKLNSNLSVDVSWKSVKEVESYKVYWSPKNNNSFKSSNFETTIGTSVKRWLDANDFPMYYRVTAVSGDLETSPSSVGKVALLSSNNGTRCQICGAESIGYCHMRNIYVCSKHHTFTSKSGQGWICP